MRIAICDDEVSMVQILEEKIKKLLPDVVIDKYLSGDELIASGSKPDILFLDIQMPGMDGMETAKVFRQDNENMILIFVTAAEEYVFQAFDVGAFHYLVKPFSDEKFKEVVTKAVHNIKRSSRLFYHKSSGFWEYDCRKTMATIYTLCWNENSGYCALYHFPCSRNRSDQ